MTLQDEIAELVYVYANRRESGFAYPTDQMVANEILDKVREALLSDVAVEKAEDAYAGRNPGVTWGNMFNAFVPAEDRARDAITAAIDAVIGKGGER